MALVSETMRDELRTSGAALELVGLASGGVLDAETLARIDIAFLSTDIVASALVSGDQLAGFFLHLDQAPKLKWLHVCSAGSDRPAISRLRARGVRVSTSSGANAAEVSQTALAGFLALARGIPDWIRAQRRHQWEPLTRGSPPRDIVGDTAVVVGLGAIGSEIARLLNALRVRVIGVSRSGEPVAECPQVFSFTQLDVALSQANWVVLACPLNDQTRGLLDQRRLGLLPRGARVINVSRGPIVDEDALVKALTSGHLAGAYLDVFATEPLPPDSPLWDLPDVLISAHRAGVSSGVHSRTVDLFLQNLQVFNDGGKLHNEV